MAGGRRERRTHNKSSETIPGNVEDGFVVEFGFGVLPLESLIRKQHLNTYFLLFNLWAPLVECLGYPGDFPEISDIPPKKTCVPWVCSDMLNCLARTPLHGRPPPHWEVSGPKSSYCAALETAARWQLSRDFGSPLDLGY